MKQYRVVVNGTEYEVGLELLAEGEASAKPQKKAAPQPVKSAPSGNGQAIAAPMPGAILDIRVKQGDSVKKGQVLVILEAMKMENEIVSPCDGKIVSVQAQKGDMVESGAPLCEIA